jgi:hypothetical protein
MLGAAPSHLLLQRIVGNMTCSRAARNVLISKTGLTKKDSIQSYSLFFFLAVVAVFRVLVSSSRWHSVFIIINTIVLLSSVLLFCHEQHCGQRGPLKRQY